MAGRTAATFSPLAGPSGDRTFLEALRLDGAARKRCQLDAAICGSPGKATYEVGEFASDAGGESLRRRLARSPCPPTLTHIDRGRVDVMYGAIKRLVCGLEWVRTSATTMYVVIGRSTAAATLLLHNSVSVALGPMNMRL